MLQFGYELSTIDVEAKIDSEGLPTHLRYTWIGDTPYIACTFELINDSIPEFVRCPRALELKPGDKAVMRPMVFQVVAVYLEYQTVIFERIDDMSLPADVMDQDGWVRAQTE